MSNEEKFETSFQLEDRELVLDEEAAKDFIDLLQSLETEDRKLDLKSRKWVKENVKKMENHEENI